MKTLFAGYFTPTEAEFTRFWTDCLFAFDANVLLGLYRSSIETQNIFFSILEEKIPDRIFLPNQAALEYLTDRLSVISIRSESYKKVADECAKFSKVLRSIVQDHGLPNGTEIVKIAGEASRRISDLVTAAAGEEPNLIQSDHVLTRLQGLFQAKTGPAYPPQRLKEIYAEGAQRFLQKIPPGYKDDKKPEPGKYGDLLIWFQLIDQAKATAKPIIFVTGDVKEDWWLEHRGATIGPRPELRQEMLTKAGVDFYMYTTPRFLEFAKQFLGLKVDTTQAESEFEKIEKQDKEATERNEISQVGFDYNLTMSDPNLQTWIGTGSYEQQVPTPQWGWYSGIKDSADYTVGWKPEDSASKNRFFALLPMNGNFYNSSTGRWKCEITNYPKSESRDLACYTLKFEPENRSRPYRNLRLRVSIALLENDSDWKYKQAIYASVVKWLDTNLINGELTTLS